MTRRFARRVEIACPYCDQLQGVEVESVFDDDVLGDCVYCGVPFVTQIHVEITVSARQLVGGQDEAERNIAKRKALSGLEKEVATG